MNFKQFLMLSEQAEIEFAPIAPGVFHATYTYTTSSPLQDDEIEHEIEPIEQQDLPKGMLEKAKEEILLNAESQKAPVNKFLQKAAMHSDMINKTMTANATLDRHHFADVKFIKGTSEFAGLGKRKYVLTFQLTKHSPESYAAHAFKRYQSSGMDRGDYLN